MRRILPLLLSFVFTAAAVAAEPPTLKSYHDNNGRDDAWSGGARMIPLHTPSGDIMDPKWMEMMSKHFPQGDCLYLANGSHLAIYDDQQACFAGLLAWLHKVDHATATSAPAPQPTARHAWHGFDRQYIALGPAC